MTTAPTQPPLCSARGCRREAVWAIEWRNPRIHGEERRKVWTACEEHLDHLREFLAARSFPLEVGLLSEGHGVAR